MKAMQVLQKGIQKLAISKEQAEETAKRCKAKSGESEQPMRRTSSKRL